MTSAITGHSRVDSTVARRPTLQRSGTSQVRFGARPDALRPGSLRSNSASPPAIAMSPSSFRLDAVPRAKIAAPATIFGIRTAYKPLWLLAMGAVGNALYSTGTLAIERSVYPRRPLMQVGDDAPPPPYFEPAFGNATAGIATGSIATAFGTAMAVTSCVLFYQDARRLSRKLNPENPSYTRANGYFATHLVGIALSVGAQFLKEALRDGPVNGDYTWVAALPGILGASLFSVTQAQAASGCEVLNKRMPLRHRSRVGFAARAGVSLYTVWSAMMSVPGFSVYGREVMRLTAQSCTTLAYALPLTTARLGRQANVDFESHQPKPSWYALQVLLLYISGRVLAGFGPDMLQQGLFDESKDTAGYVFGGATCMAVGTGTCVAALMLFRNDVRAYKPRQADVLTGLACFALISILAYVGVAQYAQQSRQTNILWAGLVPGIAGSGLRLAILPILFSYAELYQGDAPLRYRYQWTELFRAAASTCFGVWGTLSAIPTANTYAKEAVAVAAGSFATLGMAFPTTTSRRALPRYAWPVSPPATPAGQVSNGVAEFPFAHMA